MLGSPWPAVIRLDALEQPDMPSDSSAARLRCRETSGRLDAARLLSHTSAWRSGGHAVIEVPLAFRVGDATGHVVLDHAGKVSGLRVEFPRRHRMDPRCVRFFVLGSGSP